MGLEKVRLADRYDLSCTTALLNGTQALVRLVLMQRARDQQAGLDTAGYVTGYRGSPLGAVDFQMSAAGQELGQACIQLHPALNEDLAATALWGTQQAELRGEGRHDGVFGLWYGKGPGVDRSGDVLRHANCAGVSRFGGVVMALGDDHTGESSTTLHQSEGTLVDCYIPILSPAGVQEVIEFGLFGYALSRFSGNWVGIKCVKEVIEATSVVKCDVNEFNFISPDFDMPSGGLNIRLIDTPRDQERRVMGVRHRAVVKFAEANNINHRVHGLPGAAIGFVAAGKSWLDLLHAMQLLGIDEAVARRLGITTLKVGMTWPMEPHGLRNWANGLQLIVVIEEKRKLIESQVKDIIFNSRKDRRVYGHYGDNGEELFPSHFILDPVLIARRIGRILMREGRTSEGIQAAVERLERISAPKHPDSLISRRPYFCSGCPHNSSTHVPQGSRAYAGIGCHYLVQWMDRDTIGFTHMGGEGANWIGEAPFSRRHHIFQNVGDGTYNHSGIMAIRAAVAAQTTMTFKLLYNDAIAMTGGQLNDGGLTPAIVARELDAIGVRKIALVYDSKEHIDFTEFPDSIEKYERARLEQVQQQFREIEGVTAIIYVQTCAAEKRRRRRRGTFDDPDKRIFINPEICEGCGDCGKQSNCVSLVPLETELGRKRAIDQSSCNKDFSCLDGFCPSFVMLSGAQLRRSRPADLRIPELPPVSLPAIRNTHNIVITGVGGTGVITIGAILCMAGYLDGKGVGMIEMAGLAQKGGAVCIHCRIAQHPRDISAIRVAISEADCVIGGDLIVTAGTEILAMCESGRTGMVVNSHEIMTGDFARDAEFTIPGQQLRQRLFQELGDDRILMLDATRIARTILGDSIYANILLLGAAWQRGQLPLSLEALEQAIRLNGAAVDDNLMAFAIGRWWAADSTSLQDNLPQPIAPIQNITPYEYRRQHLIDHSGNALARRYQDLVEQFESSPLEEAVILNYHKLLAIKDEYEVARLHLQTEKLVRREFEGQFRMSFSLAPPILTTRSANGRPEKREFGMWILKVFSLLAKLKFLRNTRLDPFGYGKERQLQRKLVQIYERDMEMLLDNVGLQGTEAARELAELPLSVRGFGPVWEANFHRALARRDELLDHLSESRHDNLNQEAA